MKWTREDVYNYYNDYTIPSRKHAPEHPLGEWYWRGIKLAAWCERRFYAVRLLAKGFLDYFKE